LCNNNINEKGLIHLIETLKTNFSITSLNLSGNFIFVKGVKLLSEVLQSNTTLTELSY